MKIGDTVYLRYERVKILEYYPEENICKAAQVNENGRHNENTIFYFPAGILGIKENSHYESIDTNKMILDPETGIWADQWLGGKPYHIQLSDIYEETGIYYLYPLKRGKCLKKFPINEAVDFDSTPIMKIAQKVYDEVQEGDQLVNETFSGKFIKGKILTIYSINESLGMPPVYHKEITRNLVTNAYTTLYVILGIGEYIFHTKAFALYIKNLT